MALFRVSTKGHYDFINLTQKVKEVVEKSKVKDGIALIFVKGTTAALTIMEYEEGIKEDIKEVLEKMAPENADYKHHLKWGDRNGAAHIRSALIKPSLVLPVEEGELQLGQWQEIVLIDFDEKEREREIIVKIIKNE